MIVSLYFVVCMLVTTEQQLTLEEEQLELEEELKDSYKKIRRFLYGRTAIKEGVNREFIAAAAYKQDIKWPYKSPNLVDVVAYINYYCRYDDQYQADRATFFAS